MAQVAYKMRVNGLVQGVGFRWTTKMLADKLGVTGTVANLADGAVEIYARADEATMAKFKQGVKRSPTPAGRVSTYEETPLAPLPHYDGFQVIA